MPVKKRRLLYQRLIVLDSTKERDEQATEVTKEKSIASIIIFLL